MRIQLVAAIILILAETIFAGGITYKDGDKYVKIGGRLQLQYNNTESDTKPTTDELRFRRLRLFIEGSATKDWKSKFQWDFSGGKTNIWANYIQYNGFDNLKITIGNLQAKFSREELTSSKYQQIVERTFVGDHNYGTPSFQTGIHLNSKSKESPFSWAGTFAIASHDPDDKKVDFESTIQIDHDGDKKDWSDGFLLTTRLAWHPYGEVKKSQGALKSERKFSLELGGYAWSNDKDKLKAGGWGVDSSGNPIKHDLDTANGLELALAIRYDSLSVDIQLNRIKAELLESNITSGLYIDSETTLNQFSIEAGKMLIAKRLEVVANYQSQDADGYAKAWAVTSLGLNYFVKGHDIKYQLTYAMHENVDGNPLSDQNKLYAQMQFVL